MLTALSKLLPLRLDHILSFAVTLLEATDLLLQLHQLRRLLITLTKLLTMLLKLRLRLLIAPCKAARLALSSLTDWPVPDSYQVAL